MCIRSTNWIILTSSKITRKKKTSPNLIVSGTSHIYNRCQQMLQVCGLNFENSRRSRRQLSRKILLFIRIFTSRRKKFYIQRRLNKRNSEKKTFSSFERHMQHTPPILASSRRKRSLLMNFINTNSETGFNIHRWFWLNYWINLEQNSGIKNLVENCASTMIDLFFFFHSAKFYP